MAGERLIRACERGNLSQAPAPPCAPAPCRRLPRRRPSGRCAHGTAAPAAAESGCAKAADTGPGGSKVGHGSIPPRHPKSSLGMLGPRAVLSVYRPRLSVRLLSGGFFDKKGRHPLIKRPGPIREPPSRPPRVLRRTSVSPPAPEPTARPRGRLPSLSRLASPRVCAEARPAATRAGAAAGLRARATDTPQERGREAAGGAAGGGPAARIRVAAVGPRRAQRVVPGLLGPGAAGGRGRGSQTGKGRAGPDDAQGGKGLGRAGCARRPLGEARRRRSGQALGADAGAAEASG